MRKKGDVGCVGGVETWEHVRNGCRVGRANVVGEETWQVVVGWILGKEEEREREVDESVGKRKEGKGRDEG